jgi:3-dehydroquinate synthase
MKEIIQTKNYQIEISDLVNSCFSNLLTENYSDAKIVILVDDNTHDLCLDYLLTTFEVLKEAEVMLLPAGEENKVLEVCFQVWEAMSEYKISRKDLIINLGGGVVSDMGGFIASIYKRGIDFINIPTTLLAMVDASIGGKTGIDLGQYKNQLGVFSEPKAIFIDQAFLTTLESSEIQNGIAEMLKHGLIADKNHWNELVSKGLSSSLIINSIKIKHKIVEQDPKENGIRKILNFGHTFGHAFEGMLLGSERQISHGHAVAIGILCETYLSERKTNLSKDEFQEISKYILANYPIVRIEESEYETFFDLMTQDKKNSQGKIKCVLLENIGLAKFDVEISKEEVIGVLNWYSGI